MDSTSDLDIDFAALEVDVDILRLIDLYIGPDYFFFVRTNKFPNSPNSEIRKIQDRFFLELYETWFSHRNSFEKRWGVTCRSKKFVMWYSRDGMSNCRTHSRTFVFQDQDYVINATKHCRQKHIKLYLHHIYQNVNRPNPIVQIGIHNLRLIRLVLIQIGMVLGLNSSILLDQIRFKKAFLLVHFPTILRFSNGKFHIFSKI